MQEADAANTGESGSSMPNVTEMIDFVKDHGIDFLIKLAGAVAIFVIGRWVAKILVGLLGKALQRGKADQMLVGFLCKMAYTMLVVVVTIAALEQLGVNTTSFAAVIAAAGLAVGFALQGSLSNFASGVMIMIFRPFKIGDFVEAGGVSGVIVEIEIFSTIIKTGDNKKIIVPNGSITGGSIVNYSAHDTRRVDMVFGIGYDDDIKKAKDLLAKILSEDSRILKDPAPLIAVSELADSSVNFVARPWVKTADYWGVMFDVTEKVKLEFDKANISIPYPQQDVHMHQVDGKAA